MCERAGRVLCMSNRFSRERLLTVNPIWPNVFLVIDGGGAFIGISDFWECGHEGESWREGGRTAYREMPLHKQTG